MPAKKAVKRKVQVVQKDDPIVTICSNVNELRDQVITLLAEKHEEVDLQLQMLEDAEYNLSTALEALEEFAGVRPRIGGR